MSNDQFVEYGSDGLRIDKRLADNQRHFTGRYFDDDVWDYRNRLGLLESDGSYVNEIKTLNNLFDNGATLGTQTATYLTSLSVAQVAKSLTAFELQAVDQWLTETSTLSAKIIKACAFIGNTSAQRILPINGAGALTNNNTTTFGAYGAVFNGTNQSILSGSALTTLGTATGGFGCWVQSYTDGTSVIIGTTDGSQGAFRIQYNGSSNLLQGFFGGTTVHADGSYTLFPTKQHIHLIRSSGSSLSLYVNGSLIQNTVTGVTPTTTSDVVTIGADNADGTPGSFSAATVGMFVLTTTMSDAEVATLSTAVNNLMNRIGRQA